MFDLAEEVKTPIVLSEADLAEQKEIEILSTLATPELAEGATVEFILEVSNTQDFAKVLELASTSNDNKAFVKATDLNEAVKELYGKAPNAREIYLRAVYFIAELHTRCLIRLCLDNRYP